MADNKTTVAIPIEIYNKLDYLGILPSLDDDVENIRSYNIGESNYSNNKHIIQPWTIWLDWNLNPWDADIVKRVLRNKFGESRKQDYEKIIHICQERIRQIETQIGTKAEIIDFENVD